MLQQSSNLQRVAKKREAFPHQLSKYGNSNPQLIEEHQEKRVTVANQLKALGDPLRAILRIGLQCLLLPHVLHEALTIPY
jgi:hypothetical protein